MNILLVNKFLYPKGGCETYLLGLGERLKKLGHNVQFFGLENEKNTVGNEINAYVSDMDLTAGIRQNLFAPFRIIYSYEAKRKIRKLLYAFSPDAVHLNNIQFYITPSIISEIEKYRKKTKRNVKIVYTTHDYQLVCPSHGFFNCRMEVCEKCLDGNYLHCLGSRCMKNSFMKSFLAMTDAYFWKINHAYRYIDTIICPSAFMKSKLDTQKRFSDKTVLLRNFIEQDYTITAPKGDYVLEFGHLSKDKGTNTLLEVAKRNPDIRFVFAGFGKATENIKKVSNAEYVGFKSGNELRELIQGALCTVCPSEMYENCPYSVMESQLNGSPVIGANIGGIPELIKENETGLLFEAGNSDDLEEKLLRLLKNPEILETFTRNCLNTKFVTPEEYCKKLMKYYGEA